MNLVGAIVQTSSGGDMLIAGSGLLERFVATKQDVVLGPSIATLTNVTDQGCLSNSS